MYNYQLKTFLTISKDMNIHELSNHHITGFLLLREKQIEKSEVQQQFFTAKPQAMDLWELRGIHRLDRINIAMNAVILCS